MNIKTIKQMTSGFAERRYFVEVLFDGELEGTSAIDNLTRAQADEIAKRLEAGNEEDRSFQKQFDNLKNEWYNFTQEVKAIFKRGKSGNNNADNSAFRDNSACNSSDRLFKYLETGKAKFGKLKLTNAKGLRRKTGRAKKGN